MTDIAAFYFGCLSYAGHFLHRHRPRGGSLTIPDGCPWTLAHMDGGLLRNGKVADIPTGDVHRTLGGRPVLWHAFYWWDRSGDRRPACNSGFYVKGFALDEAAEAFAYACEQWPNVVTRQPFTLRLVR